MFCEAQRSGAWRHDLILLHRQDRLQVALRLRADMDSSGEPLGAGEDEAACTSASEGLEEGEVEGETLLIVESEDQGSVDLSHDQSGDSLTSDLGEEGEGGWACEDMSFYCERCHKWTPAGESSSAPPPLTWWSEVLQHL